MARRHAAEGGTLLVLLVLGVLEGGARHGEAQTVGRGTMPGRDTSGSSVPGATHGPVPVRMTPIRPSGARSAVNRTDASRFFPVVQPLGGRGEGPRPEPRAAERLNRLMIPGGGAADYFDREPVARPGSRRLAGPHNRHFVNRRR